MGQSFSLTVFTHLSMPSILLIAWSLLIADDDIVVVEVTGDPVAAFEVARKGVQRRKQARRATSV